MFSRFSFRVLGLLLLLSLSPLAFAQGDAAAASSGSPWSVGDKVVYVDLGLGGLGGVYGSMTVPPIGVGFDYVIKDDLAATLQDHLTVGGLAGYARSDYDYGAGDWHYSYFILGGRGAYHLTDLIKGQPFDPYLALTLGYNIVTVSGTNSGSASGSYLFFGGNVGARWWFTPNLGAQAELGYGLGVLSLGIAYKL